MPRSLIIALTLSLVLHGGALSMGAFCAPPAPRVPALRAFLRLPLETERLPEASFPEEELLKNTMENKTQEEAAPTQPALIERKRGPISIPVPAPGRQMDVVRERLSEYVFYPEQARGLGLEGTVILFVELAEDGRVEDVRVTTSSGYSILDNAAVKGFYAVGRLPGKSDYWEYTFRLE
jgi:TonB family protein